MKKKAIFLDFYGTIVHEDDKLISEICERIKRGTCKDVSTSEISEFWWKRFSNIFTESYGSNFQTQRQIEMQSLEDTTNHFQSNEDAGTISKSLFDYWIKPPIFEDSKGFLNALELDVCIVSNIDRSDILKAIGFHNLECQNIVTSEDACSYKPRPEIFEMALRIMSLKPEQVIHVGDSLSSDIMGAKNVGISTVWLNRKQRKRSGNIVPDIECQSLLELSDLLHE